MRRLALPVAGASVAAIAAWLSLGALAMTSDRPDAARVGALPSPWVFAGLLALAVTLAVARRPSSGRVLPLFFSAILLLPWLPAVALRPFLLWTGPLAAAVWIGVGVASAAAGDPPRALRRAATWASSPSRAPLAAGVVALVLYAGAAWHLVRAERLPGGDEPHYLIITQSLLLDGDLQIENNHRRGDYYPYFIGDLKPHYLRRGRNGQIYSVHAPGLPVLVAPAFALGGYPGVVAFLVLVAAAATALAWHVALLVTGSAAAAWFGWTAVALSPPFFFHAFAVYPDAPAAAIVLVALWTLVALARASTPGAPPGSDSRSLTRLALAGAALALLPWLHARYAVLAGALGLCVLWRLTLRPRLRAAAAFLAAPVVSAAAWFGFFSVIYGRASPAAPYGAETQIAASHALTGLPGLLFDQQFGLLANAPVYAVALAGVAALARMPGGARLAVELTASAVLYACAVTSYAMWWGGFSASARFAVPVLPALAVPAAALWARARTGATRTAAVVALAWSLFLTLILLVAERGGFIYSPREGYSLWLAWLGRLVDPAEGAPSFHRDPWGIALGHALVWVGASGAAWAIVRALERAGVRTRGGLALAALVASAVALMGAMTTVWWLRGDPAMSPATAQLDLLGKLDPALRPLGVQYRPLRLLDASSIPQRLEIPSAHRGAPRRTPDGVPLLFLPRVPAGTYRAHLESPHPAGGVAVSIGRTDLVVDRVDLGTGSAREGRLDLALPVDVHSITVRGDELAARSVRRATAVPLSLRPRAAQPSGDRAITAARYGATVAYLFDEGTFGEREGIWVAGGRDASLVFVPPAGAPAVALLLRNAPVANRVTLEAGEWRDALTLAPREERRVTVPRDPAATAIRLRVGVERGFRPALVDPASRDFRYLGVWIEPR